MKITINQAGGQWAVPEVQLLPHMNEFVGDLLPGEILELDEIDSEYWEDTQVHQDGTTVEVTGAKKYGKEPYFERVLCNLAENEDITYIFDDPRRDSGGMVAEPLDSKDDE